MKNLFALLLCFAIFPAGNSQITTVTTDVLSISGMAIHDSVLYLSGGYGTLKAVDLRGSLPAPAVTIDSLEGGFSSIAVMGDSLYLGNYDEHDILMRDLSVPNPTTVKILGIHRPRSLHARNGELYIGYGSPGSSIVKIDPSDPNPTPVLVRSGWVAPSAIGFEGDYMYVLEWSSLKISRVDTTISNQAPQLVFATSDMPMGQFFFRNGYLYVSILRGDRIAKIDLYTVTFPVTDLLTGQLDEPSNLLVYGDDLYIAQGSSGYFNVVKVPLTIVGNPDPVANTPEPFTAFPNPADELIQLSGVPPKTEVELYSADGKMVRKVNLGADGKISLEGLPGGAYWLKTLGRKPLLINKL